MTGAICRPIHPPTGRPTFAAPIFARSRPRFGSPFGRAATFTLAPPPFLTLDKKKHQRRTAKGRRENKRVINLGHMLPSSPFPLFLPFTPSPPFCRLPLTPLPAAETTTTRLHLSSAAAAAAAAAAAKSCRRQTPTRRRGHAARPLSHTRTRSHAKKVVWGEEKRGPCVEKRGKWGRHGDELGGVFPR